jgi:hypothetical protein
VKWVIILSMFLTNSLFAFSNYGSPLDTTLKQTHNRSNNFKSKSVSYQGIIESGYAFGVGKYGMNNFRLNFINSIKTDPYFSFGLGVGIRYYSQINENYSTVPSRTILPIFLNFRTDILSGKVSPYLALGVGAAISFEKILKSSSFYTGIFEGVGLLFNPSGGVSLKISEKCSVSSGFAYEIQKMNFLRYPNPETRKSVSSLSINCGISF